MNDRQKLSNAVRAARMYYYQDMTTGAIARELKVSRSTVSRLLSYAKAHGLIDIQVIDPTEEPNRLANIIRGSFQIDNVHVVSVSEVAGEAEWLQRVANYTASYLNTVLNSNMILGIAWGTTLTAISTHLLRKTTHNVQIVQLNGAGNTQSMGIEYASQIIMRFSENYQARAHLFPVPTFFDFPETNITAHATEFQLVFAGILAHGDTGAKIDAGIAKTLPAAQDHQYHTAPYKLYGGSDGKPGTAFFGLGVEITQQAAVFKRSVIIQSNRYEDNVAISIRVIPTQHVVKNPELGFSHPAVATQTTFGEYGLTDAFFGRHVNIALQYPTVQGVLRIPAHEKCSHGSDQRLQGPDFGPFTDRIAQRGAFRSQKRDQNVVHIAAVIHYKYHG